MIVRPATEADLPAIVALLAEDSLGAAREVPGSPDYRAALAAITAHPDHDMLVAERDGAVVGCFQLSFIPGLSFGGAWRGQIESVRIAAALRGTGLGAAMMRWAIARCRDRGCRLVQLTTNTARSDAQRFYRRLGFQPSHVGMKLDLGEPD